MFPKKNSRFKEEEDRTKLKRMQLKLPLIERLK